MTSTGTLANLAREADLKRGGIELPKGRPKTGATRRAVPKDAWCGVPPTKAPLGFCAGYSFGSHKLRVDMR